MIQSQQHAFNTKTPEKMHIDINSCFATVEQQYNLKLRHKPIAVVARDTPNGAIIAPSIEAKQMGIKTGMRLKEAKQIYSKLIPIQADPPKYRIIHKKLFKLLLDYSLEVEPKSIDEFIVNLERFPAAQIGMRNTAIEIKDRIKKDVGDWIRVSIGIGPNRFLAKTAAGIIKPDGLVEINADNYQSIFQNLQLQDLHGIGIQNKTRLYKKNILTPTDFLNADINTLKSAFQSVNAYYWYLRLRGWEIDDYKTKRGSFSASYVLPEPTKSAYEIKRLVRKLSEKVGNKLMEYGYRANGVFIYLKYTPNGHFKKTLHSEAILTGSQIYNLLSKDIETDIGQKFIRKTVVGCSNVQNSKSIQIGLFDQPLKDLALQKSIQEIKIKIGEDKIKPAILLNSENVAPDSIAFGK